MRKVSRFEMQELKEQAAFRRDAERRDDPRYELVPDEMTATWGGLVWREKRAKD